MYLSVCAELLTSQKVKKGEREDKCNVTFLPKFVGKVIALKAWLNAA